MISKNFFLDFKQAMTNNGLLCHEEIIADGTIHRFHVEGDKAGSINGWYIVHTGVVLAGSFGCWKRGIKQHWHSKRENELSTTEKRVLQQQIAKSKQAIEKAQYERQTEARKKANSLWANAPLADEEHPYLKTKRIKSFGLLKQKDAALMVPLFDNDNQLHSLQFILANGDKRFLSMGAYKGHYCGLGNITDTVYICEGYATAASIHEATKCHTICAFTAGNLLAVAQQIKLKHPTATIIIAADNDRLTENNPGVAEATKAANAIHAQVIIPDFTRVDTATKPSDFNDLMQLAGTEEVRRQLSVSLDKQNNSEAEKRTLRELAALSLMDYDRIRDAEAEKLGIRVSTLDELIKAERNANTPPPQSIVFPTIEAWPTPVDGNALLSSLVNILQQFVVLSESQARAIALWIVLTYCMDVVDVSPILNIASPEKRCGKSTLLSLLQRLVARPLLAANISSAALFRTIESLHPTLLLDEVDTFIDNEKSELRGIINSGHTRSTAFVIRTVGDTHEPSIFSTWCAKCLAGIGHLPDTITDRSIIIQLRRKLPHETVANLRHSDKSLLNNIQSQCARFAADNLNAIRNACPKLPSTLNDRAADSWEPLFAIADIAGNTWPQHARQAALALSEVEDVMSLAVELLQDIQTIFIQKKVAKMPSTELLETLCLDSEAPWATYNRGKTMTARQLSKKLKDFGILSKNHRFGLNVLKGYQLEDMQDAFHRYVPAPENGILSATTLQLNNDAAPNPILSATNGVYVLPVAATRYTNP